MNQEMNASTITIPGLVIAYKTWGEPDLPPLIALHGWLDNANSFDLLAPYLAKQFYVIAIDLPGHGQSSHLPEGCYYHFTDGIFYVLQIVKAFGFEQYHLLGHSMGACLASLIAGVAPNQILSMVLIEGLGPFSESEESCCNQLERYAKLACEDAAHEIKSYPSLELAVHARAKRGFLAPKYINILSQRGLQRRKETFYWRHDRRLLLATPLRLTEQQILSCLNNIRAKSCLIWASNGFELNQAQREHREQAVKNLQIYHLEGGHHVHMEHPDTVAQCLEEFYKTL
ncbi:putative lipase LipA [Legionella micdadei]|uniref:Pimeloyl-ACP methyl ester carboxylesterase n=2 Tax=Legionella micdadei TaxID=451 RepID=A0A098GDR6_LEGMI|nr:lipase A [Legionella micdadei]CEG60132.1 putative lipase LipA [Legionella micdadei]SCY64899.1 Pimeloyl-ACP methyl ester carboxylesterase [Legionella micdadei]